MVGYDFDKTIYRGDCTTNFFVYYNLHRPYLLLLTPYYLIILLLYGVKIIGKKKFKELMFFYLKSSSTVEKCAEKFWDKNIRKIEKWYLSQQKPDDVFVSAGLEFIVSIAMKRLGISNFMATKYDLKTGKIIGKNCYGEEKVNRFREVFGDTVLDAYYSDSLSDLPMMKISKKGFLVNKTKITEVDLGK